MMGRSSMSKQMMREGGKVKPKKKESEDSKQARADSKALVGNLNLTPREKALKEVKDRSAREKETKKNNKERKASKEKANKEIRKKATGDAVYKKYVNQYQREKDRTGVNKKADTFFDKVGDKVRGSAVGKYAKSKGTGTFSRDDEAQMQARKDVKGYKKGGMAKKMARGGMTKRMMGASNAPESGPTKPMVSPKPKPKGPAPYDDSDPKPRKMKSGGKVRGYGMARGGKACKMR